MHRIAHLSDLHCPPADLSQARALQEAVNASRPAVIVITGDVTRAGRRREFAAAKALIAPFPAPIMAVPGNHDVPVFEPALRAFAPFARFKAVFPHARFDAGDTFTIAGFNTARTLSLSLDWSLGRVDQASFAGALEHCDARKESPVRILACHHPLTPDANDWRRSATRGGPEALTLAAAHGVAVLLHGHLHRSSTRWHSTPQGPVLIIGAGTPLSERERGSGSSFNLIDLDGHALSVTAMDWNGRGYEPVRRQDFSLGSARRNPNWAGTF